MPNVTHATFCRYCQTEITETKKGFPDRCPECFKIIVKPSNKHFDTPDYIFHQRRDLESRLKDEKIIPGSDDHMDALAEIQMSEDEWHRTSLFEDKRAALADALACMSHLPYSRLNREEASYLLKMGATIGNMARTIQELYKSGVSLYDREIRPVRPDAGSYEWDQASTATGRDT